MAGRDALEAVARSTEGCTMIARVLSMLRFRPCARPITNRAQSRPPNGSHRHTARRSLACGLAGYILASAALATMLETSKPQWRDPEFAHHLDQLRVWKRKAPD